MSHTSQVRYQTETLPVVPFVNFVAPSFYVGDAIYGGIGAAAGFIGRQFKAIWVKMREARALDTLTHLDDRTLNDIGLRRSQIDNVARLVAENPGVDYRVWCQ